MNSLNYKQYKVLLVDDELENLENLLFTFDLTFDIVTAASGAEALDILSQDSIAVVISDHRMPKMTGTELLSRVKESHPQSVRMLITAYADIDAAVDAINQGNVFRYMRKDQSFSEIEVYIKQAINYYHVKSENERLYEELEQRTLQTITALAKALEARDPYTFGHSERVTALAVGVAGILGFSAEEQELIRVGGLLHDIGKIAVADEVLRKPGRLTDEEFNLIKQHPAEGAKIIEPIPILQSINEIVLNHHERCDGKGYPRGLAFGGQTMERCQPMLSANFIKFASWILPVSDTYDAMTSVRPYRDPLPHQTAMDEIARCRGSQFVPEVVDAFFEHIQRCKEEKGGHIFDIRFRR